MQAVVLVGGAGTRLLARVPDRPKPLADVGGRPFLAYVLDALREQGICDVVLAAGLGAEAIAGVFGAEFDEVRLRYSNEPAPLGTGGAVRHALPLLDDGPFLLLNGDSLTPFDVPALLEACGTTGAGLALTVCHQDDVSRFGRVELGDGRVQGLSEKGASGAGLINCGVYVVDEPCRGFLAGLGERFSFERDVLVPWCAKHSAAYIVSPGPFIDIGVPEDYDRAEAVLAAWPRPQQPTNYSEAPRRE